MKQQRQKVLDDLIKDFRKGIHKNFKLFRELLPLSGNFEIDLDKAFKKGFDEHAYYGTVINESEEQWNQVRPYYFHLQHSDNSRTLNIYKR